jgi:hypothetical protein
MTWVKFFRSKSIEQSLKSTKKGDIYINPLMKGNNKLQLKQMFNMAKTRFIFEENMKKFGNNMDSPFHKFPRGILKEENLLHKRITKIRLGLINSKEKEFKWRQDFMNKRPYRGTPQAIRGIMPSLIKQTAIKVERSMGGGQNNKKVIAESVKGVPKVQKDVTRKSKEHFKNLMDDSVISTKTVSNMIASRSKKNTEKFESMKKKAVEKKEKETLIENQKAEDKQNKE